MSARLLRRNNTLAILLYKNNTGGEGLPVLCDVVGASIVHKIVKIAYIALQCKLLIVKYIYTEHRIDRKGTDSIAESAHTKWSRMSGSGAQASLRSPAQPCWSAE
jgi:hypothetical protein